MNFWKSLKRPIFALAPMDDVTDTVFRQIIASCAAPDVFFTEFTNVEGMLSSGAEHVMRRLKFTEKERPLVAQIWGVEPDHFRQASEILVEMGFDGIDINMGCPDRAVVKKGCCSALCEYPEKAKKIIAATIKGANGLPVSVKTRCGLRSWKTQEWVGHLVDSKIAALTLHGRIASEMSHFPANWEEIAKAVEVRNKINPGVIVLGNGDVKDYQDGLEKVKQFGVDGVMIGRGIFQNPWAFDRNGHRPQLNESLQKLLEHTKLFDRVWGKNKNFALLRKFFKAYVHGFEGASQIRSELMTTADLKGVEAVLDTHFFSTPFSSG